VTKKSSGIRKTKGNTTRSKTGAAGRSDRHLRRPIGLRTSSSRLLPSEPSPLPSSVAAALLPSGVGSPASAGASGAGGETRRHRESREAAQAAIDAALDKKALMPVLLDVSGRATYTDFIGVVSGRSDRQVDAIAAHISDVMGDRGWRLLGREGTGNGRWTLLDFGDVVVHVFYHPVREVYDIESLWIDAPRVSLKVPPEAMQVQEGQLFYER
jgi:ribosome-associated protein